MKFNNTLFSVCSFVLFGMFATSCDKGKEMESYPIAYDYHSLAFSPSNWYVLTPNGQNQLAQFAPAALYDIELESLLEEDAMFLLPFQKLELLSESLVKVTYTDGLSTLDTVLAYTKVGGKINIQLGVGLSETLVFSDGGEPLTIRLGVVSTIYSYKLPNGSVQYSHTDVRFTPETDPVKILNEIRSARNLTPNDTISVNVSAFLFK